jgi:hypothetical protein
MINFIKNFFRPEPVASWVFVGPVPKPYQSKEEYYDLAMRSAALKKEYPRETDRAEAVLWRWHNRDWIWKQK